MRSERPRTLASSKIDVVKMPRQNVQRVTGTVQKEQFEIDGEDETRRQ